MKKAFVVTLSDRYDYIDKSFESLSRNDLSGYDLWFFIDANGDLKTIRDLAIKHNLPDFEMVDSL